MNHFIFAMLLTCFLYLYGRFGWLADGTARYPMYEKKSNCGNKIGIAGIPSLRVKNEKYNAWCYKE